MSTGRIQDPEGAKTVILSFKTVAGVALAISRKNIKLIRFAEVRTGRLRVDAYATSRGKQDSNAQRKRMILIYKVSSEPGAMHIKGGPQRKEAVAYHDAATS